MQAVWLAPFFMSLNIVNIATDHSPPPKRRRHLRLDYLFTVINHLSDNKERIDFGTVIGVYVDQSTGKEYPTTIGIINYSKAGTHVVPAYPRGGIK